jgi:hypothetical protein
MQTMLDLISWVRVSCDFTSNAKEVQLSIAHRPVDASPPHLTHHLCTNTHWRLAPTEHWPLLKTPPTENSYLLNTHWKPAPTLKTGSHWRLAPTEDWLPVKTLPLSVSQGCTPRCWGDVVALIYYKEGSESGKANYLYSCDSVASGFCRVLFVIHLAYSLVHLFAYPFHWLIPFIPTLTNIKTGTYWKLALTVGITTGDTCCTQTYAFTSIHKVCCFIKVLLYCINTVRCPLVLR